CAARSNGPGSSAPTTIVVARSRTSGASAVRPRAACPADADPPPAMASAAATHSVRAFRRPAGPRSIISRIIVTCWAALKGCATEAPLKGCATEAPLKGCATEAPPEGLRYRSAATEILRRTLQLAVFDGNRCCRQLV